MNQYYRDIGRPRVVDKQAVIAAVRDAADARAAASRAADSASKLIRVTAMLPLSRLDYWERLIRQELAADSRESARRRWMFWAKRSRPVSWVDLASWDGRRREAALRTVAGPAPNRFFLALVLRRLNDWVPEVRAAARAMVTPMVASTDADDVAVVLGYTLSAWTSWGRMAKEDQQVLLDLVADERIASALVRTVIESPAGPMPSLFAQLGRTDVLDDHVAEIARRAVQPAVRARAYRALFEERVTWMEGRLWQWVDKTASCGGMRTVVSERPLGPVHDRWALVVEAGADRSSIVRRVAAEMLIRDLEEIGEAGRALATTFAQDPSRAVSERGEFALRRLEA